MTPGTSRSTTTNKNKTTRPRGRTRAVSVSTHPSTSPCELSSLHRHLMGRRGNKTEKPSADDYTSLKFLGFEQIFKNALTGCEFLSAFLFLLGGLAVGLYLVDFLLVIVLAPNSDDWRL